MQHPSSFKRIVRLVVLPMFAFALTVGHASATTSSKSKPTSATKSTSSAKPAPKPATKPVTKPAAKPALKPATAPKATTPTRTYIGGGKDGPCACSKNKSCRDGAGKKYCVESTGRKRIIG